MAEIELIQFPYSHYNEKARWGLDWKRVPHTRRSLLPGPHIPVVRRLTGDTQVPVLRVDGELVAGSARILALLEERHPEPSLLPEDPALRRRALEIQEWFDEEVGPRVRRSLFAVMIGEPAYLCRMFASERSAPMRAFYRSTLPLVGGLMRKSMGIAGEASIREAAEGTRAGLDFVAKEAGPTGCLVGDRFSVADLAAASLLAPAANPPDSPMTRPEPQPASLQRWLATWSDHAGVAWVHEQYRRHRPASAEIGRETPKGAP